MNNDKYVFYTPAPHSLDTALAKWLNATARRYFGPSLRLFVEVSEGAEVDKQFRVTARSHSDVESVTFGPSLCEICYVIQSCGWGE